MENEIRETTPAPALAARLRTLLDDRGLTASEVARAAGMHRQQLDTILSGKNRNPGVLTVARIVEAANATMGEMFPDDQGPAESRR